MSDDGTIRTELDGRVATVVLDRPDKCNALTMDMWRMLELTVRGLGEDPRVLAIVIVGAGRDFCAGADIRELPLDSDAFHRLHLAAERTIADAPKPVIAAVRGSCVGGGCEIAVAADLCFAEPTARFGITASRLGVVYPYTPTQRLVAAVGRGRARRMLYGGELFDAAWAERAGLVSEVVDGDVEEFAHGYAQMLVRRSQTTIAAARQNTAGTPADLAWPDTDYVEGIRAYRHGREPEFGTLPRPLRL
nr:enoyl-CoA hydratase/isomerase family protein [Nocardioides zeae]